MASPSLALIYTIFFAFLSHVSLVRSKIVSGDIDTRAVKHLCFMRCVVTIYCVEFCKAFRELQSQSLRANLSIFVPQDWAFVTRFCFKDSVGQMQYSFEYPTVSNNLL